MAKPDRGPLRIGLLLESALTPELWSGVPLGLAQGLQANGAEVVPLITLPDLLERAARRLPMWRARAGLRYAGATHQVRKASQLDAILQIGSSTAVDIELPLVFFLDMTLRQALEVRDEWVLSHPVRERQSWERRQQRLYQRSDRILTMGAWAADSVVRDYGVDSNRVHVVGGGATHTVDASSRDWSTPRFLFIGRDYERKNGPAVVRAFATLRSERPDATLDIVGDHPRIDQAGVTGHGRLALGDLAGRAHVERLLRRATCLVVPSVYEPFGIVYTEAAFAGIPSIATTVGAEFVDSSCGRRVTPGDEAGLLAAMRELSDPALARRLGDNANARSRLFTWPIVGGRVLRAFAEVLGRPVDNLPDYL
jgi:glycosyltransferase involved in cell wall biosynthesis